MKLQRLISRRRLIGATISLIMGWAVATVVAMSCVVWAGSANRNSYKDESGAWVTGSKGFGYADRMTLNSKYEGIPHRSWSGTAQAGFPFLMYTRSNDRIEYIPGIYLGSVLTDSPSRLSEGYELSKTGGGSRGSPFASPVILPVMPIWFGAITNSVLYGSVFFGLGALMTRSLRHFRPPDPWLCHSCRYDLRGLDGVICPECGERAENDS